MGEGSVPLDERHLVYRSMLAAFGHMGREVPGLRLHCDNVVPHARGLGSSSAAIVAGVCARPRPGRRRLAADGRRRASSRSPPTSRGTRTTWPRRCTAASPSPGARATGSGPPRSRSTRACQVVALVPPVGVETSVARGLLPATVSHGDAAANAGRAALLVAALGRPARAAARRHRGPAAPGLPGAGHAGLAAARPGAARRRASPRSCPVPGRPCWCSPTAASSGRSPAAPPRAGPR